MCGNIFAAHISCTLLSSLSGIKILHFAWFRSPLLPREYILIPSKSPSDQPQPTIKIPTNCPVSTISTRTLRHFYLGFEQFIEFLLEQLYNVKENGSILRQRFYCVQGVDASLGAAGASPNAQRVEGGHPVGGKESSRRLRPLQCNGPSDMGGSVMRHRLVWGSVWGRQYDYEYLFVRLSLVKGNSGSLWSTQQVW